jgi:hypothetical protein
MTLRTCAIFLFLGAALTACSGRGALPAPSALLAPADAALAPDALDGVQPDGEGGFGVGLATYTFLSGPGISETYQFCQTPGYQFTGCPGHMPSLLTSRFKYKKRPNADFTIESIASAKMGRFDYAQGGSAKGYYRSYYSVAYTKSTFHWTDTLHVTSKTLAAGTRVSIGVSLGLTHISSGVGCYRFGPSSGGLNFHGTGVDGYGRHLNIEGFCYWPSDGYYGEFIYHAGDMYTQSPTDSGTIETAVGKSLKIGAIGAVGTQACGTESCTYDSGASLGGTLTWKITHLPAGVSYTTDSRAQY